MPSTTNQRGRKRHRDETNKEPIDRYKGYFMEITDMFIQELSQKFNTDNYKPLVAISNIINAKVKPEISDVFFDLGVYRYEVEMTTLDNELKHWYRYKDQHKLKTIKEIHNEFATKKLKALFRGLGGT